MRKIKIFGLLVVLLSLALVGCASPVSDDFETPPEEYTVTFNTNGGSAVKSQTVKSGEKVTKPTDPTKDAIASETYTFDNWYISNDNGTTLSETAFDFNTVITDNITLYAKWIVNAVTHTVTFDTNGGSTAPVEQTIVHGNKATKPADPTKAETDTERYSFAYWYTSDKPDSAFDFNTEIKADITLYAKWNTTVLYSITIASSTNGTVSTDKTSAKAGETVKLTVTPNTGYEIENITVNNGAVSLSGEGNTRTFTMPAGIVTVSATFKLIKYKVTYAAYTENGVELLSESTANFEPGAKLDKEVSISDVAYVKYSGTMGNADMTLEPELWFKEGAPVKFFLGTTLLQNVNGFFENISLLCKDSTSNVISLEKTVSKNEISNTFEMNKISLYGVFDLDEEEYIYHLEENSNGNGKKQNFNKIELLDKYLSLYFSSPLKALQK